MDNKEGKMRGRTDWNDSAEAFLNERKEEEATRGEKTEQQQANEKLQYCTPTDLVSL